MLTTLSPVGAEQTGPGTRRRTPAASVVSQVVPYPWNNVVPVVRDYQKARPQKQAVHSYYGMEGYHHGSYAWSKA
jgi:branched-chain amino acid transport system substrate-binding protein